MSNVSVETASLEVTGQEIIVAGRKSGNAPAVVINPVVPVPDPNNLLAWAEALTDVLTKAFSPDGSGLISTSSNSTLRLPIRDSSGRIIVDLDGLHIFDKFGFQVVDANLVNIDTAHLVDAAIVTSKLATAAVNVERLAALAVEASKLADGSVVAGKIAVNTIVAGDGVIAVAAIGTALIANLAVTEALIGTAAVVEAKIQNLAVTDAKIFDLAVQKLTAGTIAVGGIFVGSTRFEINGATSQIIIKDNQGIPKTRVILGQLAGGAADWGLQIFDAAGNLFFGQNTTGADILNAQQNWSEVTDDGNAPADNATVGADWNVDLSNIPTGVVEFYYQATAPVGANTGDFWVDTGDDKTYRWDGAAWILVQDEDIAQGIADAAGAQGTADGRVSTFAATTPPTANASGDLWIDTDDDNKLYRWSGSAWVAYDDSRIATALTDASNAQATADGKIISFHQDAEPTADGVGDIWVDTNDSNKLYRWSGSVWVSVRDATISVAQADASQGIADASTAQGDADTAQSTADSKVITFIQASPPTALATGDLWIDSDDDNKLYRWSGSAWNAVDDSRIATALTDASNAQATADGKIVSFIQASAPTAEGVGDIWVDSDDGNKTYRWSGSAWISVQDGTISAAQVDATQAITDASDAQATADGKVVTFVQAAAPTAEGVGDLWMDTDDDNKLYRWSGSTWVEYAQEVADWTKVFGVGIPADDADVTQTKINLGLEITAAGGSLYAGKTTFASTTAGWWIGNDGVTPKLHIGNATFSLKWDGTNVDIVGGLKTAGGSGQRVEVDKATNEMRFFADRGDATIAEVVNVGVNTVDGDEYFLAVGSETSGFSRSAAAFSSNSASSKPTVFVRNAGQGEAVNIRAKGSASTAKGMIIHSNATLAIQASSDTTTSGESVIFAEATEAGTRGIQAAGAAFDFYASGAGTNYGPFTGAHDCCVLQTETLEVGDILIDGSLISSKNVSNTIHEGLLSTEANKPAIGVFVQKITGVGRFNKVSAIEDYPGDLSSYDYGIVNAVGEGQINVCDANGDIQIGDLIVTSGVTGKGMRQDDDLLHNYTVARARESVIWSEEPDNIKMISCIYLCG